MPKINGPVKLGFIGFGIMGERLARAALNHDKATLCVSGVYDPSPATTAKLKDIDTTLKAYDSADEIIAQSDCLHIASPPASHLQYLKRCADAGKAVLCEKPLSTDVEVAATVVRDMAKQNLRAGVNFPFTSSFAVDHIQRWMVDGTVGVPERVDVELAFAAWPRTWQMDAISWLDGRAEGGFTREVGSHVLFLSRRIFGPLTLNNSSCGYPNETRSERAITADLKAGKMPVQIIGGVGTTNKDDHNTWTLTGSHGRVRLRDWSYAEREIDGQWQAPADALPNEQARPLILKRQLDKVAAMTRGEATTLASLEEAFEVQTIVETILKAPAA